MNYSKCVFNHVYPTIELDLSDLTEVLSHESISEKGAIDVRKNSQTVTSKHLDNILSENVASVWSSACSGQYLGYNDDNQVSEKYWH